MAEVLACLARGGTVLTGNARAARALLRRFGETQRAAGMNAWPTPHIHDWESWLSMLWAEHIFHVPQSPRPLSPWQERTVWTRHIGAESGEAESIAKLAAEAWRLLSSYNRHGERSGSWQGPASGDAEAFRKWALAFDRECRKNDWTSRSKLPALLTRSIQQSTPGLPTELLLVGFDRITPAQQELLDAASARGCTAAPLSPPRDHPAVRLVKATDLRDELATCAAWLRRKLEANPQMRIAVLVPEIGASRGEIERAFGRVLMPESAGIDDRRAMPWEFSLGRPLAAVPVVKATLLLLRWLIEPLSQLEISWLMLSGFVTPDDPAPSLFPPLPGEEMASVDAEMRKYGGFPPEASLAMIASYRPRLNAATARAFFATLRRLQELAATENFSAQTKAIPDWLDFADRILREAGWPGPRRLGSVEYQALQRWERLRSEFAALSFDGSRITYLNFVTMLDAYSRETIFSPESTDAPIQIMGPFESAGQFFDAVWFLGAYDRQWPHPLLPSWLQRGAAMPHASIEADWRLAGEVTQRIAASAAEVWFSSAERDGTGELRPSPLLRDLGAASIGSGEFRRELRLPTAAKAALQTVPFFDGDPVPWPQHLDAGGAEILKRQSACPFQAFAARRLGAEELHAAERGLTPLDRGSILHEALSSLWSETPSGGESLHDRSDLVKAMANGGLASMLEHHIAKAFRSREKGYERSEWSRRYLNIEKRRLRNVLLHWLQHESKRVDFAVVECETKRKAGIHGLMLNLRVDRIDRVPGGRLILDYKTGEVKPAMWEGARPDEPQLPLYAIHGGIDDLKGVLVAQIRPGNMDFKGRVENATATVSNELKAQDDLVKAPLNETILGEWSDALSNLADDFLLGNAAVAPKSYPETCKYCALPSLCRVAETAVALEAAASEETAEDDARGIVNE
jgi:ATP-dependent helicase/nuclease subunit B